MSNRGRQQVLLVFAFALGMSALVVSWFEGQSVHAGLWGIQDCSRGGCHSVRWDDVPNTDLDFLIAGYGGTVSALVAGMLAGILAIAAMRGQRSWVSLRAARFASTAAILTIAWFVIRMFTDSHLDVSWGLVVGVVGAVGVAATLPRGHASATNIK